MRIRAGAREAHRKKLGRKGRATMEALWSHYGADAFFAGLELERPQPQWDHYGATMESLWERAGVT